MATSIAEGVGSAGPYSSSFGYNRNDLPVTATLPGGTGVQEQMGYDQNSRLVTQTLSGPATANTLSNTYAYAYNALGWTTALTSVVSGITTTQLYTHDDQARLTGTSLPGVAESWRYDGNGNVLTTTSTSTRSVNRDLRKGEGDVHATTALHPLGDEVDRQP